LSLSGLEKKIFVEVFGDFDSHTAMESERIYHHIGK